jgi:hypothetical protein
VINQYAAVIQFEGSIFLMVVLQRLVFQPECRFFDMVNMFFIPSGPTDSAICFIQKSNFYAQDMQKRLNEFTTWEKHFPAAAILHAGTPYYNLVNIFNGNCSACSSCSPGGLGNQNSRFDQKEGVYRREGTASVQVLGLPLSQWNKSVEQCVQRKSA